MTMIKTWICAGSLLALFTAAAPAADLAAPAAPLPPPEPEPTHWFVRLGALAVVNNSSSRLFTQPVYNGFGIGPQIYQPGRGESVSNLYTLSVQAGYFFTPNWSIEVMSGFPVWQTTKITGFSPLGPPGGTVLSKSMPASVPITVAYHLTQLGAFQPYLGVGLAPIFSIAQRDGFVTNPVTDPSIALVLQGGADFMINRNWGVFFDVKTYFDRSVGTSSGLNTALGAVHTNSTALTDARPWLFTSGVTYRF